MRTVIILFIIFCSLLCCTFLFSQPSTIIYDNSTTIEITPGADVCADAVTINGVFTGGGTICTGPLPVTLSLFTALSEKNNVILSWKTETEINNSGFDVERKLIDGLWEKIAFVQGSGTTNSAAEYSYTDKKLKPGKYIYRLKQIDYNGNYEYFDLALPVIISKPKEFSLGQSYPNPSNPVSNIDFQLPEKTFVKIEVYDLLGKLVAELVKGELDAGIHTAEFNGSGLGSGTYIYRITAGNFTEVKKLVLLK
ncbi:MAG: T9SS type A sorting domain-containing protein [Ignavibacteria bacterium]|nr:T9SS type A sorting domain-containing protein [Ignavibacteria bacterium]